jgi:hypothetical protein
VSLSAHEILEGVHGVSHHFAVSREGAIAAITRIHLRMTREIVLYTFSSLPLSVKQHDVPGPSLPKSQSVAHTSRIHSPSSDVRSTLRQQAPSVDLARCYILDMRYGSVSPGNARVEHSTKAHRSGIRGTFQDA